MISRRTAAIGGVLLVLLTVLATRALAGAGWPWRPARGTLAALQRQPGVGGLAQGLSLVLDHYYRQPHMAGVSAGALAGAVRALGDPYSQYLSPRAYRSLLGAASGRYTGIGVEVEPAASGPPTIVRVLPGSPAAQAVPGGNPSDAAVGLRPGDRLVSVDGASLRGLDAAAIHSRLAGPAGTRVRVTVDRATAGGGVVALTFDLKREPIVLQTVTAHMLSGGVGYLAIQMFNAQTAAGVDRALAAMRAQHLRALVVDLRDNPGGVLQAAVSVARDLVPPGVVAYLQPRDGPRQAIRVRRTRPLGVPLAVLINGRTASAAEVLAGAVKDRGAGTVVGEPSFGKAVVQRVFPLTGGGALKLTTARYLTPNGHNLDAKGLAPTLVVPFPGETAGRMGKVATDPQLAAAVRLLRERAA